MQPLVSAFTPHRYRLLASLARGGMGEVFVADQVGTPELRLAVKTLASESALEGSALQRFLDEARLSVRLDHPHLAPALDFGEAAGRPWMAFPLLRGADLATCFAASGKSGRPPPHAVLCLIGAQVARGLAWAHALRDESGPLGVIHRDLSPGNIFVGTDGVVRVLDFGAHAGRHRRTRTATGLVVGKVEYMAPEQLRGAALDHRVDLYALGLCLLEGALGRRPFSGMSDAERLRKLFAAEIPDPARISPPLPLALVELIRRACAPARDSRFPDAAEMAEALEQLAVTLDARPAEVQLKAWLDSLIAPSFHQDLDRRLAGRAGELAAEGEAGEPFTWSAPAVGELAVYASSPSGLEVIPEELLSTAGVALEAPKTVAEPPGLAETVVRSRSRPDETVRLPTEIKALHGFPSPPPTEARPVHPTQPAPAIASAGRSPPETVRLASPPPTRQPRPPRPMWPFAVVALLAALLGFLAGELLR